MSPLQKGPLWGPLEDVVNKDELKKKYIDLKIKPFSTNNINTDKMVTAKHPEIQSPEVEVAAPNIAVPKEITESPEDQQNELERRIYWKSHKVLKRRTNLETVLITWKLQRMIWLSTN